MLIIDGEIIYTMTINKNSAIAVSVPLLEEVQQAIERLNELQRQERKKTLQQWDSKTGRLPAALADLTVKHFTEEALRYFLRNHIDPRQVGEEKDVLTEVRKLRNNVFSFMQVQERTYLMPFVQDVYELKNRTAILEETNFDMLNLMEIFIDLMLAGIGLTDEEQEEYKARAAQEFKRKKAIHLANKPK